MKTAKRAVGLLVLALAPASMAGLRPTTPPRPRPAPHLPPAPSPAARRARAGQ